MKERDNNRAAPTPSVIPPPASSTAAFVTDAEPLDEPPSIDPKALAEIGDKDALFEVLWTRCLEAWDDDKPHAALLEHALRTESLPELAGRYRAIKEEGGERAVRAQKKIDGIVISATQLLMATKTPPRTKPPWQWTAAAAIIFAIVCAFLFYQLFIPHR